jgi:hypothetical protein
MRQTDIVVIGGVEVGIEAEVACATASGGPEPSANARQETDVIRSAGNAPASMTTGVCSHGAGSKVRARAIWVSSGGF